LATSTARASKVVRSWSMKRGRKNPVVLGIVLVAAEDTLAGDRAAADAEAISRPKYSVWVAQQIFARRG